MRGWLGWIAIGWLVALCALALVAYGSPASHPSLDDRTRAVAQQLRCPICQGESVADSPSDISKAMRALIRTRLEEGQSPAQIKAFFVAKYGSWILLAPPASGVGSFAWLAPPLLLLGGLGLLITLVVDWRTRGRAPAAAASTAYLERVRAELAQE
jgi:cytochrome c-type biogenesis protein CcmH